LQQTFGELVIHTPSTTVNYRLPWTFSTFDYRTLCGLLADQGKFTFETAKVDGRTGRTVHTDRGDIRADHIVDALGWRRLLGSGEVVQPPDALLSRGLEVHPHGSGSDLEIWIDRSYVPAGYGWSFPAGDEVRIGVGSFDPRFHVREPTERLAADLQAPAVRYQGNWIPHALRGAAEDGVFFVGDSAGHCLPLTAEGIRTALYFGLAVGRALQDCLGGQCTAREALSRYARFSASHATAYRWLLRCQRLIPRVAPRLLAGSLRAMQSRRFLDWSFGQYLEIAHPRFVAAGVRGARAVSVP
jgi:flavin-dependent dehydrogenase